MLMINVVQSPIQTIPGAEALFRKLNIPARPNVATLSKQRQKLKSNLECMVLQYDALAKSIIDGRVRLHRMTLDIQRGNDIDAAREAHVAELLELKTRQRKEAAELKLQRAMFVAGVRHSAGVAALLLAQDDQPDEVLRGFSVCPRVLFVVISSVSFFRMIVMLMVPMVVMAVPTTPMTMPVMLMAITGCMMWSALYFHSLMFKCVLNNFPC